VIIPTNRNAMVGITIRNFVLNIRNLLCLKSEKRQK
jgi:hypothetical protein